MDKGIAQFIGISLIIVAIISSFVFLMLKLDFDKQTIFLCEEVSKDPNLDMEECPAHQSNIPWLIILGFVVSAILAIAGIFLIAYKSKTFKEGSKDEAKIKIDESKLDEDEKKIYDILKNSDGSVYQSDLIKETGLSKVKITRILDKMESKRIIERKRRGMTNIIVLR